MGWGHFPHSEFTLPVLCRPPIHPYIRPSIHAFCSLVPLFRSFPPSLFESISSHPRQIPFPPQFTGRGRGGGGNSAPPSFPSWTKVMMVQEEECTEEGGREEG